MLESDVVHIATSALFVAAKVSAPLLVASLVIGLVISLFQAIFSVQDQTLSMVPRLAVGAAVLALGGNWMLREIVDWTRELFLAIPGYLG